ncbi:MAG: histidine--tRNA ligase, partial [Rhizobiales bacterium]|nr:histidine--tRNA ligase [Hyphomicrobiales bacterium]
KKQNRPKARLAKGFRDIGPEEMRGVKRMLRTIEEVYESYGFEPVEQPFIEYTDALGKFLPDQDRPNEGVFSFQDDDEQWLSLRYDLTAPLARYVAENQQALAMPYRSYRQGWVFRNEKPGPGRFRQFMQFDADTVGTANPAADAEVCMMAADTMEALGIAPEHYKVKFNNRKLLDGLLLEIGVAETDTVTRLRVLRALDKYDRLKREGVEALLGKGRIDESGDRTEGAGLQRDQIVKLLLFLLSPYGVRGENLESWRADNFAAIGQLEKLNIANEAFRQGLEELKTMANVFSSADYGSKVTFDSSVVRGLEYYTGPVFECELLMEARNEDGQLVRFGSVGGGGRYDDLVARFTGQKVPATGFSIGVSRLYAALKLLGKAQEGSAAQAPVIVLVLDRDRQGDYQRMVSDLRKAGIRAEMYLGTSGLKAQMKYADRRGSPLVIIQGGDEKAKGEVQIKDLRLGAELAKNIESREEYKETRLAQVTVPEANLIAAVKEALGRG